MASSNHGHAGSAVASYAARMKSASCLRAAAYFCSRDAVYESPNRAAATILRSDLVEPAAVVIHKIVEAAVVELRVLQECQVRRGRASGKFVVGGETQIGQDDHKRARDVVGTVAELAVRYVLERVLNDADVIGQHRQMVERGRRRALLRQSSPARADRGGRAR